MTLISDNQIHYIGVYSGGSVVIVKTIARASLLVHAHQTIQLSLCPVNGNTVILEETSSIRNTGSSSHTVRGPRHMAGKCHSKCAFFKYFYVTFVCILCHSFEY